MEFKKILLVVSICWLSLSLSAQKRLDVSGTVYEKGTNAPIVGVNVLLKGTTKGGMTDIDGNYSLTDVPANGILVFSIQRIIQMN